MIEAQWTLTAYARSTWAARYSRKHLMREGASRTLCGISPPANTPNGHNHAGRCKRCFELAGRVR